MRGEMKKWARVIAAVLLGTALALLLPAKDGGWAHAKKDKKGQG